VTVFAAIAQGLGEVGLDRQGFWLLFISYVDKTNVRQTISAEKSLAGLVSVGDVGVIAIHEDRVINFLRSSRF
jgi:hypothetical protein